MGVMERYENRIKNKKEDENKEAVKNGGVAERFLTREIVSSPPAFQVWLRCLSWSRRKDAL